MNNGYVYMKHSKRKEKTYWVCHRKPECTKMAATTDDPLVMVTTPEHNHAPDQDYVRAKQVVQEIKEAGVRQPERAPGLLIEQKKQDLPEEVLAKLPTTSALTRTVNRTRQAQLPPNPKSLDDLHELPPEYKLTLKSENFLCYDSFGEDDGPRIIVFATNDNLRKLAASHTWFCDGTFRICPDLFTQVFTIHGMFHEAAFPFVYALLPDKTEVSYTAVFDAVQERCDQLHIQCSEPETVVNDFEMAIINAVKAKHPRSSLRLCFFHLGQSAYRLVFYSW